MENDCIEGVHGLELWISEWEADDVQGRLAWADFRKAQAWVSHHIKQIAPDAMTAGEWKQTERVILFDTERDDGVAAKLYKVEIRDVAALVQTQRELDVNGRPAT